MLSPAHRLTDSESFRRAVRSGRRAGSTTLVVHLSAGPALTAPRVGFVVSKAVGNAVIRNRVQRRLRHLARGRLSALPQGSELVVRALPPAAEASSAELAVDLDRCLERVSQPVTQPVSSRVPS